MKNTAFLALGSNIGDRELNIHNAVKEIDKQAGCKVIKSSSLYETKPFGFAEQENFYNGVIKIETELGAGELFDLIKQIENKIGRKQTFKWGPREIDIDLLFFNDEIINNDILRVPHPGIAERDFVLVPLSEIAPGYIHPELKEKISDICKAVTGKNIIRKI